MPPLLFAVHASACISSLQEAFSALPSIFSPYTAQSIRELTLRNTSPVWICNLLSDCSMNTLLLFFFFLGMHLWHMEVPRLGVESELQLLAYRVRAVSATCTTAHSNTGSLTY